VTAACSIAGVGPFDAEGLNYFDGMGNDNLVEFGLAMAGREHIVPFATTAAAEMLENLEDLAASTTGGGLGARARGRCSLSRISDRTPGTDRVACECAFRATVVLGCVGGCDGRGGVRGRGARR
jgi:hypothetical protein